MATEITTMDVDAARFAEVERREVEAASLAVDLHDFGVTRLTQSELEAEAQRLGVSPQLLTTFLHDAGIRMMPDEHE